MASTRVPRGPAVRVKAVGSGHPQSVAAIKLLTVYLGTSFQDEKINAVPLSVEDVLCFLAGVEATDTEVSILMNPYRALGRFGGKGHGARYCAPCSYP